MGCVGYIGGIKVYIGAAWGYIVGLAGHIGGIKGYIGLIRGYIESQKKYIPYLSKGNEPILYCTIIAKYILIFAWSTAIFIDYDFYIVFHIGAITNLYKYCALYSYKLNTAGIKI